MKRGGGALDAGEVYRPELASVPAPRSSGLGSWAFDLAAFGQFPALDTFVASL
jgi:hypothetical protein